jgi:multiple sugar transport system ATP-binding protein
MSSLAVKGVAKSFGGVPALNGIDFFVNDGEFCVLAGPRAAGKSTVLRAIAGLEQVDSGTIEIDGEVVNELRPRQRDVAMVFQTDVLFPKMSVYQNIAFSLAARRTPREEIDTRVARVAGLLKLTAKLKERTPLLSDADRRRTAIARAFVREAGLCLLDEPLSGVDTGFRDELRDEIKLLHREFPTTRLYVTSDPTEAMTLADRTILMRDGKVEQEGTPMELFERPRSRFVAGFFGWPKMNFLTGALRRSESGDVIRLGTDGGLVVKLPPNRLPKEVADGLSVILGLRPENMMRAVRASPPDGVFRHDSEIEMLRPMGSRTYATFKMGGTPVVAELLAHDVSRIGDRIPIDVNVKRAVIFDATTEKSI